MYNKFGVKDLYEVSLKTTDNIEINGTQYLPDEVVLFFNELQIASVIPDTTLVEASGGKSNFSWVMWENVKGVDFVFEDGLVNFPAFNLLTQSRMVGSGATQLTIPMRESVTTNASGIAQLSYTVATSRSVFVYRVSGDIITGKITPIGVSGDEIDLGVGNAYASILVDYYFADDNISLYEIGGETFKGFFKMTSKINFTDEKDGVRTTMLFVLPKVRILSNLNLTLGLKAGPVVSTFRIRAFPDTDGKTLARFIYLNQDIEG